MSYSNGEAIEVAGQRLESKESCTSALHKEVYPPVRIAVETSTASSTPANADCFVIDIPPLFPADHKAQASIHPFSALDIIGPQGVDQTKLNDCWFEASLASFSATEHGRQAIADMITKENDGSYTVRFPGDRDRPLTITESDLKNRKLRNSTLWANILEAANLKLNPHHAEDGGSPERGVQGATYAIALLSGEGARPVRTDLLKPEQLQTYLQTQLLHGLPIVADGEKPDGPVVDEHVYSVLGASNGNVLVRNPWGQQNPGEYQDRPAVGHTKDGVTNLGDGELLMSDEYFEKYFANIISETKSSISDKSSDDHTSKLESESVSDSVCTPGEGYWQVAEKLAATVSGDKSPSEADIVKAWLDLLSIDNVDYHDVPETTTQVGQKLLDQANWQRFLDDYSSEAAS